jgi:OmpA-OmpF porin, OOP family
LKTAGLSGQAATWVGGTGETPLPAASMERILGGDTLKQMADRLAISPATITAAAGVGIPKLIAALTPGGTVPHELPAPARAFLGSLTPPIVPPVTTTRIDPPPLATPVPPPRPAVDTVRPVPLATETAEPRSRGMSWILPLLTLGGIILLGLIWQMWGGLMKAPQVASAPQATAPAPTVAPTPAAPPAPAPVAPPATTAQTAPTQTPPPVAQPPVAPTAATNSTAPQPNLLLGNTDGQVTIGGIVKDDATRTSILDALKTAFGADKVHGNIAVDPTVAATAPWTSKLGDLLSNFKINGLQALLHGSSINVGGLIPDADRSKLIASVKSLFGSDTTVGNLSDNVPLLVADTTAQAAAALSGLKSGYSAKDVVEVLNATIINFPTSGADVPTESRGLLDLAAQKLHQLPKGTVIEVAGFTDSTGDAAANLTLSQRRAEAVRTILMQDGVDQTMLTAKGYGGASPVASNDTEAGRLRNRRIEYRASGG